MENLENTVWETPQLIVESWTITEDLLGFKLTPIHS